MSRDQAPPPVVWEDQAYADAIDGICALLASVDELDASITRLPLQDPVVALRNVAKVRQALDFIESAATRAR